MSLGLAPGFMAVAVAFMNTVCLGGDILGSASSNALPSFSFAGAMRLVWNPPEVLRILACRAPAFSARSFNATMAFSVPAHEKPLGKSSLAIWQMAPLPSFLAASLHRASSLLFSTPATDSIACLPTAAASCMASPRSLTSFSPSSKVKTPAAQRAVYSPRERPAQTWNLSTTSGLSPRSFSTPARPAMNITGWQYLVSSSFASGPFLQSSITSKPRMLFALASIS
mmetsp:Transcript_7578/g.17367  ORF Transcript_7578/g.17367 Transcript_7578/m.17367 type:complete len:226 (+) Transcript_7578:146-823(+)